MDYKLSKEQYHELYIALLSAYSNRDALEQMVRFKLGESLETITGGENQSAVVFNLMKWAESKGKLQELITQAYQTNPGNLELKAFYQKLLETQDSQKNSPTPILLKTKQRTGINPFIFGNPVPPERFYGRRATIIDIKNRIGAISPQSINIVGQRRQGKSSVLRYIKEKTEVFCLPEQKSLIVILDLQSDKFHTPEGIIEGLRREITRLTGKEAWSKNVNNDPFEIEDALTALRDNYRLIVMLDEFERIGLRLDQFQDWGEDWRSKASNELLTLVIASIRPLEEIYKPLELTSPFGNIFSTTILGALEKDAWNQLVKNGFNGVETFSQKYLQWIEDLAGGLPFYTQMAAALLWQYDDFTQAETEFIFQGNQHFQQLWKDLKEPEKQIMKNTVNGVSIALLSATFVDIFKRHGLLCSDGRVFSSAFAKFVKEQR